MFDVQDDPGTAETGRHTLRRSRIVAFTASLFLSALLLVGLPRPGWGHDVPNEIHFTGFAKPEGDRLHVLLRVPLIMLASVNLPKRGQGYLALDRMEPVADRAVNAIARQVRFEEDGRLLRHSAAAYRVSQPSEEAFDSYANALAHVEGPPVPDDAQVFWNQGFFDVHLQYPIESSKAAFSMDFRVGSGLSGRLQLAMRFIPPDRAPLTYVIPGGFGNLALNPRWFDAAGLFVKRGFHHILDGTDHLLFLLCLIVPFGLHRLWHLAGVITAFTLGHSVTLIASALGHAPAGEWFPPLIEAVIALSILYMAIENLLASWWQGSRVIVLRWRWMIAAAFGLIHGFGFAFVLREQLQFAGSYMLTSLLAFNVGVELGQLLVLFLVVPVVALTFHTPRTHAACVAVTSVLVGHTAWHWLGERVGELRYVQWPGLADVSSLIVPLSLVLALGLIVSTWWRTRYQSRRPGHIGRSRAE